MQVWDLDLTCDIKQAVPVSLSAQEMLTRYHVCQNDELALLLSESRPHLVGLPVGFSGRAEVRIVYNVALRYFALDPECHTICAWHTQG